MLVNQDSKIRSQGVTNSFIVPTDRSLLAEKEETQVDPEPKEPENAARREETQVTGEARR